MIPIARDEFVSITRGVVKRGLTDIEPKVAAGAGGGVIFGIFVTILASYHVPITPEVQQWGPYLVAVACGYIFPSSGHIITTRSSDDSRTSTTTTSGAVETIVTGAIPVQQPKQAPDVPLSQLLKGSAPDDQATQILPPPINLGGQS
jgi:hypothetical protein